MSEPAPEPVQQGEPVTIQPADQATGQPSDQTAPVDPGTSNESTGTGDENYTEQPDGTMTGQPTPEPAVQSGPAYAEPVQPPDAGPGEQSLAEQQAAGSSVVGDVDQPATGPGSSDSAAAPPAVTPPEQAAQAQGVDEQTLPVNPATSNESPKLPPNLTSSAARSHAMLEQAQAAGQDGEASEGDRLGRVLSIVELALSELAKFLPDHVRAPAQVEARQAVDRL